MKYFIVLVSAIMLVMGVINSFAQTLQEIPLTEFPFTGEKEPVIQASIKLDTHQVKTDEGLNLILLLRNNSGLDTTIVNPIDGLGIHLLDESGIDVLLPIRTKYHTWDPIVQKQIPFNCIAIDHLEINGRVFHDNIWQKETITLPKGSTYQIFLKVVYAIKSGTKNPTIRKI